MLITEEDRRRLLPLAVVIRVLLWGQLLARVPMMIMHPPPAPSAGGSAPGGYYPPPRRDYYGPGPGSYGPPPPRRDYYGAPRRDFYGGAPQGNGYYRSGSSSFGNSSYYAPPPPPPPMRRPARPVYRGTDEERARSTTLYVGNLPYSFVQVDVEDLFGRFGRIAKITLPMDRYTGRNRGFAFVEYEVRKDADDAFAKYDGYMLEGRALRLDWDVAGERRSNPAPAPPSAAGYDRPRSPRSPPRY